MSKLCMYGVGVVLSTCVTLESAASTSISVERWQTDRKFALGNGEDESYSAYYNGVSVTHVFERTNKASIGIKGKIFLEGSDEIQGEEFDVSGFSFETSRQFSNQSNIILEANLGFSYRTYDVPIVDKVKYFGFGLGGAFAYPVITNKLFIGGAANYQLLKDTDNSEAREGHQLSGIRADLGIIYAYQQISARVGYRLRHFTTSDITTVSFEDKARGVFVSATINF